LAAAFYFVNLDQFKIQTSLVPARDRVVGILLGLSMMWLVFDQLWGAPAAVEMRQKLISTLRLLAQLAREPIANDLPVAIEQSYRLREKINLRCNTVRNLADAVLFEVGSSRQQHLALRKQILGWMPQLRALFLTRITLLKYRLQLPGFELPEELRSAQREFDERLAATLDGMADRFEGEAHRETESLGASLTRLDAKVRSCDSTESQGLIAAHSQTFLLLSHAIEKLASSLDKEF
jgi:multidrug resistance protein MdtO